MRSGAYLSYDSSNGGMARTAETKKAAERSALEHHQGGLNMTSDANEPRSSSHPKSGDTKQNRPSGKWKASGLVVWTPDSGVSVEDFHAVLTGRKTAEEVFGERQER